MKIAFNGYGCVGAPLDDHVKDEEELGFLHCPMSAVNWLNTCSPY
jgi:hypothetical protein